MRRILVIRGGAIGDFVLTLPTIGALRSAFPSSRLEILGYKHIAALAEQRFYADAVRSIEYSALAAFFGRNTELPSELADYFNSFDLVISYLFDPDGNFERNLRRCGVENLIVGPAKVSDGAHATLQLARPLDELGLTPHAADACLYPSENDRAFASAFLRNCERPIIALHPGSGSEKKNWPLASWTELAERLMSRAALLIIGGEADQERLASFRALRATFAENIPLPQLAAIIESCALFVGHDSGISHIAAAVGTPCVLLFGPTHPEVWAPQNKRVLRAPAGDLTKLEVSAVAEAVDQELMRIGIST
ncbi:MAG: glycosyltransferase family 9 protein [Verrucomicrobiota bacterium]|nr:glycosyltransferase family 9 protein [Verrucomicrobiota bacterium]